LSGADGKPISAWGKVTKKLTFGLHTFMVSFILAAVSKPILGIDFLSAHRLLVDPFSKAVLFASSLKPVGCTVAAATSGFAASISHIVPSVRSLLTSFPSIIGDGKGTPRPRHGVRHFVETTGRPVFAKARRLDPDKLKIAEAEFRSLEAAGIVRRSNSPWSSPLHMVPKQDGSWRPCGDYRRLNTVTTPDRYPLPSMLDLSAKLHGCKFFSCVDLVKGYHQIPMAQEDIEKTAIITPFGLFEYLFMPFGLTNAAQSFQRLMDKLFRHLPFVFTYLDDHLIASGTLEEHLLHLTQFFQVLQENGVRVCCSISQVPRSYGGRGWDNLSPQAHCRRSGLPTADGHQAALAIFRSHQFFQAVSPSGGPHSSAAHGFVVRFTKGPALVFRCRCRVRRRQGRPGCRSSALPSRAKLRPLPLC